MAPGLVVRRVVSGVTFDTRLLLVLVAVVLARVLWVRWKKGRGALH